MADCYSFRMLDPFRGLAQVVDVGGADAVSRDGIHWSLYIQGETEATMLPDGAVCEVSLPDVKFGDWSVQQGLKRAPVRQVIDYGHIDGLGTQLLDALKGSLPRLPFPLCDRYELWLLESGRQCPLALLQSSCRAPDTASPADFRWRPGQRACQEFSVSRPGLTVAVGDAAGQVGELINAAAGTAPTACWFFRDDNGGGRDVDTLEEFPETYFPELLIKTQWDNWKQRTLVAAFLDWQAPWLLTMPTLSDALRSRLEPAAFSHALTVAEQYRCYPKVIDTPGLRAALVEARFRQSAAADGTPDEPGQRNPTAFFITGN